MATDEILLKVALDLNKVKDQTQDMSMYWEKYNAEIKKGTNAMQKQADDTAKAYETVNKKIKENISQVGNEGKAIDQLGKKFEDLNKKNQKSFDSKELDKFNDTLKKVSGSIGQLDKLELSTEDIDVLSKKLSGVETDFEALNILVDFFESKLGSSVNVAVESFDAVSRKIQETKQIIEATNNYIKSIDASIKITPEGDERNNLIKEREAQKKALQEETIALASYQVQLQYAREESGSMATELRRVKDELVQLELAGERGGDRWIELSNQAKQYNTAIKDTNEELNRASKSTAGLDNIIGAATGIVAVFTAAQGAQALFGDESEDLAKSLVKLTGAIALLNGLQQVQTELAKKGTIANRALSIVQVQYGIATNGAATATARLVAASKLLGIGLIIGGLAYLVTNWKEISKYIGLTSDATERLNDINKKSNEIVGDQIAKLTILVDAVKKGSLSIIEKEKAVEDYNKTFGETLGTVKNYAELEQKLINSGADYIKYLGLKAKAEAAYQLAIERTKAALEKRASTENTLDDYLTSFFTSGVKLAKGEKTISTSDARTARNEKEAKELEKQSDELLKERENFNDEYEALAAQLGIKITKTTKAIADDTKKFTALLEDLVNKALDLKNKLIEDGREREKSIITDQLNADKEKYKKEIELLKVSNATKLQLLEAYNKIYNQETGFAYEDYRKTISEIDRKYDQEAEEVRFSALSAIAEVYGTSEQLELEAIDKKFEAIRERLQKQIDATKDIFKKEEYQTYFDFTFTAQKDKKKFVETDNSFDRLDREKEIAESILLIQQANMRDILKNEKIKQLQLLQLDRETLKKRLDIYKNGIKDEEQINLFEELTNTLENSVDASEIESAAAKLREAFGDETANEILKTVGALKDIGKEIKAIGTQSKLGETVSEIAAWTSSLEGFGTKLGESLGLEGESLSAFAEATAQAIDSTFQALSSTFDAEIEQRQAKVDAIQESIDAVENEVEKEKQLYEDGYANNYELRQEDLASLKKQKAEEQQELEKAQKKKAALNKVEMLGNLAVQASNLITAITAITEAHSGIPFVGVALAVGFIATMFAAIAQAKAQAQSVTGGQQFRKGLGEGHLDLHGPRHEERGFGLFNSKTGERVAEFEDSERLYALTKGQQSKYGHIMDALIADAQGRGNIDSTLEGYYGVRKTGKQTMQVIKHVNNISIAAQKSKENASKDGNSLISEMREFKETFKREFEGYKKERDNKTENWETPEHFYVKKSNVTKKYRK